MKAIFAIRENRSIKYEVAKLNYVELRNELMNSGCSIEGEIAVLRDRVMRVWLRRNANNLPFVPWYIWDVAESNPVKGAESERVETDGAMDSQGEEERARITPTTSQLSAGEGDQSGRTESASTESTVTGGRLMIATADVHVAPVVATVSSATATTTTITATTTRTSVRTQESAYAALGKPYNTGEVRSSAPPSWTSSYQYPGHWEYYSAERVRSLRPAGLLGGPAITPKQPSNVPRIISQQWFTPAQNWDTRRQITKSDASLSTSEYEELPTRMSKRSDDAHTHDSASSSSSRKKKPAKARRGEQARQPQREHVRAAEYRAEVGRCNLSNERHSTPVLPRQQVPTEDEIGAKGRRVLERAKDHLKKSCVGKPVEPPPREQQRRTHTRSEKKAAYVEKPHKSTKRERRRRTRARLSDSESSIDSQEELSEYSSRGSKQCFLLSDDEPEVKPRKCAPRESLRSSKAQAVKLLKGWGVSFTGEERSEDPEEFLEQLEDCRDGAEESDADILSALPCILSKRAGRWYRTEKKYIKDWQSFARAFRSQFITEYDREDLLDDLRRRTQDKEEKISSYLSSIKYIVSRFKKPPSRRSIVETAWRNLLPAYRKAMGDRLVDSLEDIELYGKRWERQRALDNRYVPPPPAEKMHVPGAAPIRAVKKGRVAEVKETSEVAAVVTQPANVEPAGTSKKSKGQKKAEQAAAAATTNVTEPTSSSEQQGEERVDALKPTSQVRAWPQQNASVQPRIQATSQVNAGRPPVASAPQGTYASAVHMQTANVATGGYAVQLRPEQGMMQQRTLSPRPSGDGQFFGACYTCQSPGHRASQCPEIVCYRCQFKGHTSRNCSLPPQPRPYQRPEQQQQPNVSCQNCGTANVTFKSCPNCSALCARLGNVRTGEQ